MFVTTQHNDTSRNTKDTFRCCQNVLTPAKTPRLHLDVCHNTSTPAATSRLHSNVCQNALTPARTPRLHSNVCHNISTAAGTPRLHSNVCHNTSTPAGTPRLHSKCLSERIDTSKNTKAKSKCCYVPRSCVETIFSHDQLIVQQHLVSGNGGKPSHTRSVAVCPCVVIIKNGHTHAILSPRGIPLAMYSCIARVTPQGGQLGNATTLQQK